MSSREALAATPVLLVRHGRTEWNEQGRIQGHTDIPLSEEGRARLRESRIPTAFAGFRWHSSPLVRAVESARLLGASLTAVDARLMEMHWGEWEGETRASLRARLGERMRRLEDRGIDFRPPGGESPRELTRRLEGWLRDVSAGGQGIVAVTHKGILRAALALATGWDLRGSAPCRLDWEHAHLFSIREGGWTSSRRTSPCTRTTSRATPPGPGHAHPALRNEAPAGKEVRKPARRRRTRIMMRDP